MLNLLATRLDRRWVRLVFTLGVTFCVPCIRIQQVIADGVGDDATVPVHVSEDVSALLNAHCLECHGSDEAESGIRLDELHALQLNDRLSIFNHMQEQVFLRAMPPRDSEPLPDSVREALLSWLSAELGKYDASELDEKLARPEFGNAIDHDQLFSGEFAHLPGATKDRRWLISEFIFDAKVNRLLDYQGVREIDGIRTVVEGDNGVNLGTRFGGQSVRQSITNPFLLPSTVGVRYFSHDTLSRGHFLTMLSNAEKIAAHMTSESTMRSQYPAMYRLLQAEFEHRATLNQREQFLAKHVERLLKEVFGEHHNALLPPFQRVEVADPPVITHGDGSPRKETNLGLLARFDDQDLRAIYEGLAEYRLEGRTLEEVIERCERDWFFYGVHEKRIENRISIIKVLHVNWDMERVNADIVKKGYRPPPFKPLADDEMLEVQRALKTHRQPGDRFQQVIDKCVAGWETEFRILREETGEPTDAELQAVIDELYARVFERSPTETERRDANKLTRGYLVALDRQAAFAKLIESLILSSEFSYRHEFGVGTPDDHGRRLMSPRDASYALSYALTDSSPDAELVAAVEQGRLETRDDYRREVERMLQRRDRFTVIDETIQKSGFNASITNQPIRKLRFFREYFGYPKAMTVFKDDARFGAGRHDGTVGRLVDEADMLVAHVLEKDQNVFETLLTTEEFYVFHSGDNEAMQAASDRLRTIYDYFKDLDWRNFTEEQLYEHWPFIHSIKMRGTVFDDFETNERRRRDWVRSFKRTMESLELRLGQGQANAMPYDELPMAYWHKGNATGRTGQVMRGHEVTTYFNIDYRDWDYPTQQPAKISNRKGILTHPAWLIAHSLNTETDPVRRGKWIREKLLAGMIDDVPITVDAVIPEDPHRTLRQRLEKRTGDDYCWKCHRQMDPLGLAFESYDDFGRFRLDERLEHEENLVTPAKEAPIVQGIQVANYRSLPVDTRGVLKGTGDDTLEGPVDDALELVERLAASTRVRQSIVRHVFRYFLGRNERLSDSKTLMDADRAYVESGGSFDALIVSLLTSDSFIYRKPSEN